MGNATEKKRPMTREEYRVYFEQIEEKRRQVQADPLRLKYHVQPPVGWLNDPNGLCQKDGVYHIYYQYVPFYPDLCSVLWGHVTTEDFIDYQTQEPALYPDSRWDANGAYSGSVFQRDGIMYVCYTGNVRHTGRNYNYVTDGREQNTILMMSEDGYSFTEKQLLMRNDDYPADLSRHVRDPQIFCEDGRYYMIQGARDLKACGSVLLFESDNLSDWTYRLRFCTEKPFGFMWECPNYLKIDGRQFLIICPQGMKTDGLDYADSDQCGYFPLKYDFAGRDYELGAFRQMDRGFDFYAPQVFQDESGRWILIGWMGRPGMQYDHKQTLKNGWIHALTIPRELYVNAEGRLCQRPVKELERMRKDGVTESLDDEFELPVSACFELKLSLETPEEEFELILRESAFLCYKGGILTLDLNVCGAGRSIRGVQIAGIRSLRILSDASSLELFVNDGEEVFTTRIYDSMTDLHVKLEAGRLRGQAEYYQF